MAEKYWEMTREGLEDCLECYLPDGSCYVDWRCPFSKPDTPPQSDRKLIAAGNALRRDGPMNMKTLARSISVHPAKVRHMVKAGLLIVDTPAGKPKRAKLIMGVRDAH